MTFTSRFEIVVFGFLFCCSSIFAGDGYHRVVSFSPSLTELVFHLGAGNRLIARSSVCNYPEKALNLPVAGDFADPVTERVLDLKPDLVISNTVVNPGCIRVFRQHGIRVEIMPCNNVKQYRAWVSRLGLLLNAQKTAEKEINRIDAFESYPFSGKKVLWVIWDNPVMIAGAGSFPDELIRLAGGKNIAGSIPNPYARCPIDWLLEHPADIVIWSASRKGWKRDKFKKCGAAFSSEKIVDDLDPDLMQRPGPRIFDAICVLHERIK